MSTPTLSVGGSDSTCSQPRILSCDEVESFSRAVSSRASVSSQESESPWSRPTTPTTVHTDDGDDVFQFSSAPLTPRERPPAITVSFYLIHYDSSTTDIYNIPVFENTTLKEVGRTLQKQFGSKNELVFLTNNYEIPFDSEKKVMNILPKIPFGDVKMLNSSHRFPYVQYAKLPMLRNGLRDKVLCAGIGFCCHKGHSGDIVTQGFAFIPYNHTGLQYARSSNLHEAAAHGKINLVEEYLDSIPPDVAAESLADHRGYTPLHYSAQNGHLEVCDKILVKCGYQLLTCVDHCRRTPLHCALYWKRYDVIPYLLQADEGTFNSTKDDFNNTCADLFLKLKPEGIQYILKNLDVDCLDQGLRVFFLQQPLVLKDMQLVERLCNLTAEVLNTRHPDRFGRTILHDAAAICDKDVVHLLVSAGCDVTTQDDDGRLPLFYACGAGNVPAVPSLINESVSNDNLCQAVHYAAISRHKQSVLSILQVRQNIQLNEETKQVVHDVTQRFDACDKEIILLLKDDNSFLDRILLEICHDLDNNDFLEKLVNGKLVNVNTQDFMGRTALHESCQISNLDAVKTFLQCEDIDPNVTDWRGSTPLHYACKSGHVEIVSVMLLDNRIAFDVVDHLGRTPLLESLYHRHADLARLIVTSPRDAGFCKSDKDGESCFSFAHLLDKECIDLVLAKGPPTRFDMHAPEQFVPSFRTTKCWSVWENEKPLKLGIHDMRYRKRSGQVSLKCPGCQLDVPYHAVHSWSRYHVCTEKLIQQENDLTLSTTRSITENWKLRQQEAQRSDVQVKRKTPKTLPFVHHCYSVSDVVSPLHSAVKNSSVGTLQAICHDQEQLLVKDNLGRDPLELAVDANKPLMVEAILQKYKELGLSAHSESQLVIRCLKIQTWSETEEAGRDKILSQLIDFGFDVNGYCTLKQHSGSGDVHDKVCLKHCRYETPLSVAIKKELKMCVEMLLACGVVINEEQGLCALHEASRGGNDDLLNMIVMEIDFSSFVDSKQCQMLMDIVCQLPNKNLNLFKVLISCFPAVLNQEVILDPVIPTRPKPVDKGDGPDVLSYKGNTYLEKILLFGPLVDNRTEQVSHQSDEVRDIALYVIESGHELGEVKLTGKSSCTIHAGCAALLAAIEKQQWVVVDKLLKRRVGERIWECSFMKNDCCMHLDISADEILFLLGVGHTPAHLVEQFLYAGVRMNEFKRQSDNQGESDNPYWEKVKVVLDVIETHCNARKSSSAVPLFELFKFYLAHPIVTKSVLSTLQKMKDVICSSSKNDNWRKKKTVSCEQLQFLLSSITVARNSMYEGRSLLHQACKEGHVHLVTHLLTLNKNLGLNVETAGGETPLFLSAKYGNADVFEILLAEESVDVVDKQHAISVCCGFEVLPFFGKLEVTANYVATWLNKKKKLLCDTKSKVEERKKIIQHLLSATINVDVSHDLYGPPLFGACVSGMLSTVHDLLQQGADPLVSFYNMLALTAAVYGGHEETALVILNHCNSQKLKISGIDMQILLLHSSRTGLWKVTDFLLTDIIPEDGAGVDHVAIATDASSDNHRQNVLHHMVIGGQLKLMSQFLSRFESLSMTLSMQADSSSRSPLWYALSYHYWDIASVLLLFSGHRKFCFSDLSRKRQYSVYDKEICGHRQKVSIVPISSGNVMKSIGEDTNSVIRGNSLSQRKSKAKATFMEYISMTKHSLQQLAYLRIPHSQADEAERDIFENLVKHHEGPRYKKAEILKMAGSVCYIASSEKPMVHEKIDVFGNIIKFDEINNRPSEHLRSMDEVKLFLHYLSNPSVPMLHRACSAGDLSTVRQIVQYSPGAIDHLDAAKRSALFYALYQGHIDIAEFLLTSGCDTSAGCAVLEAVLFYCCTLKSRVYSTTKKWINVYLRYTKLDNTSRFVHGTLKQFLDAHEACCSFGPHSGCLPPEDGSCEQYIESNILPVISRLMTPELLAKTSTNFLKAALSYLSLKSIIDLSISAGFLLDNHDDNVDMLSCIMTLALPKGVHSERLQRLVQQTETSAIFVAGVSKVLPMASIVSLATERRYWKLLPVLCKLSDASIMEDVEVRTAWHTALQTATFEGEETVVAHVVALFPTPTETDKLVIRVALQCACHKGHSNIVRFFLASGIKAGMVFMDKHRQLECPRFKLYHKLRWSALHWAAAGGSLDTLQALMFSDIESVDFNMDELIFVAAAYGREEIVQNLWTSDIVLESHEPLQISRRIDYRSIFLTAARNGHFNLCTKMLREYDIDVQSRSLDTAHHYACVRGSSDFVNSLISHNIIDCWSPDENGYSPAIYAQVMGHTTLMEMIFDYCKSQGEDQFLFQSNGVPVCTGWFKMLMAENMDIQTDEQAVCPTTHYSLREQPWDGIFYALQHGHDSVAVVMIKGIRHLEFSLFNTSDDGSTVLHYAAKGGSLLSLKLLLEILTSSQAYNCAAILDFPDRKGLTAIAYAVEYQNIACFDELVSHHAFVGWVNPNSQENLLHLAVRTGNKEVVEAVLHVCDSSLLITGDVCGIQPIGFACGLGYIDMVPLLAVDVVPRDQHNVHVESKSADFTCLICLFSQCCGWIHHINEPNYLPTVPETLANLASIDTTLAFKKDTIAWICRLMKYCHGCTTLLKVFIRYSGFDEDIFKAICCRRKLMKFSHIHHPEEEAVMTFMKHDRQGEGIELLIHTLCTQPSKVSHVILDNLHRSMRDNIQMAKLFDSMEIQRQDYKFSCAEASLVFGLLNTVTILVNNSGDPFGLSFHEEIRPLLPLKSQWLMGACKVQDKIWMESICKTWTPTARLNHADIWLSANWNEAALEVLHKHNRQPVRDVEVTQANVKIEFDYDSFKTKSQELGADNLNLMAIINSVVISEQVPEFIRHINTYSSSSSVMVQCISSDSLSLPHGSHSNVLPIQLENDHDGGKLFAIAKYTIDKHAMQEAEEKRLLEKLQGAVNDFEAQISSFAPSKQRITIDINLRSIQSIGDRIECLQVLTDASCLGFLGGLAKTLNECKELYESITAFYEGRCPNIKRIVDCLQFLKVIKFEFVVDCEPRMQSPKGSPLDNISDENYVWKFGFHQSQIVYDPCNFPWLKILRLELLSALNLANPSKLQVAVDWNSFRDIENMVDLEDIITKTLSYIVNQTSTNYQHKLHIETKFTHMYLSRCTSKSDVKLYHQDGCLYLTFLLGENTSGKRPMSLPNISKCFVQFLVSDVMSSVKLEDFKQTLTKQLDISVAEVQRKFGCDIDLSLSWDTLSELIAELCMSDNFAHPFDSITNVCSNSLYPSVVKYFKQALEDYLHSPSRLLQRVPTKARPLFWTALPGFIIGANNLPSCCVVNPDFCSDLLFWKQAPVWKEGTRNHQNKVNLCMTRYGFVLRESKGKNKKANAENDANNNGNIVTTCEKNEVEIIEEQLGGNVRTIKHTRHCLRHSELVPETMSDLQNKWREDNSQECVQPGFVSYLGSLFVLGGNSEIQNILKILPQKIAVGFTSSSDGVPESVAMFSIKRHMNQSLAATDGRTVNMKHEFPAELMHFHTNMVCDPFPFSFNMEIKAFLQKPEFEGMADSVIKDALDRILSSLSTVARFKARSSKRRSTTTRCHPADSVVVKKKRRSRSRLLSQYIQHVHVGCTKSFAESPDDIICQKHGCAEEPFNMYLMKNKTLNIVLTKKLEDGHLCLGRRTIDKTMFSLLEKLHLYHLRQEIEKSVIRPLSEGFSTLLGKQISDGDIHIQHHGKSNTVVKLPKMTVDMLETILLCRKYIVDEIVNSVQFIADNVSKLYHKFEQKFVSLHIINIPRTRRTREMEPGFEFHKGSLKFRWPFEDMVSSTDPIFPKANVLIHHLVTTKLKVQQDKIDAMGKIIYPSLCRLVEQDSFTLFFPQDKDNVTCVIALCNIYGETVPCSALTMSGVSITHLDDCGKQVHDSIMLKSVDNSKDGLTKINIRIDESKLRPHGYCDIKVNGTSISCSPFSVHTTWSHISSKPGEHSNMVDDSSPSHSVSPRSVPLCVEAGKSICLILQHKPPVHRTLLEMVKDLQKQVAKKSRKQMLLKKNLKNAKRMKYWKEYPLSSTSVYYKHSSSDNCVTVWDAINETNGSITLKPGRVGTVRVLAKCNHCEEFLGVLSPMGFCLPPQALLVKTVPGKVCAARCLVLPEHPVDSESSEAVQQSTCVVTAGHCPLFHVQLRDAFGNIVRNGPIGELPKIMIKGCDGFSSNTHVDWVDGKCGIVNVKTEPLTKQGVYSLDIDSNTISGPKIQVNAGPVCPAKCYVIGKGKSAAVFNFQAILNLFLCDEFENRIAINKSNLKLVKATFANSECCVRQSLEETQCIHVSYRPSLVGEMQLQVMVNALHINGSPFTIVVQQRSSFEERLQNFRGLLKQNKNTYKSKLLRLSLSRKRVFDQSFQAFENLTRNELTENLIIRFVGEDGIDCGGLTREWYQLLSQDIFNPNYALFVRTPDGTYKPNKDSDIHPEHIRMFNFVGKLFAKAVFDGECLDIHFTPSMYKNLLDIPMDQDDLRAVEPTIHKSLGQLMELETNDDVESMYLNFQIDDVKFGVSKSVLLKDKGADINVTLENRDEYVQLYTKYLLTDCVSQQITGFKKGFATLIPMSSLKDFSESELELIICGHEEINLDTLRHHTKYQCYSANSPQIEWLWEYLEAANQDTLASFLQFTTGVRRLPIYLRGWNMTISKVYCKKQDTLPTSHTCFNELVLPEYSTKELLQKKLQTALDYGRLGFGMA